MNIDYLTGNVINPEASKPISKVKTYEDPDSKYHNV